MTPFQFHSCILHLNAENSAMLLNSRPKRPPYVVFFLLYEFRVVWNIISLINSFPVFFMKENRVSLDASIFLIRVDPAIKSEECDLSCLIFDFWFYQRVRVVCVLYYVLYCMCYMHVFVLNACCKNNKNKDLLYWRAVFLCCIFRIVFSCYIFCVVLCIILLCCIFGVLFFVLYFCIIFFVLYFCVILFVFYSLCCFFRVVFFML